MISIQFIFLFFILFTQIVSSLNPYEQANNNTLTNYLNAIQKPDIPEALKSVSNDVIYQFHGLNRLIPLSGTYQGVQTVQQFFTNLSQTLNPFQISQISSPIIQNDTAFITYSETSTVIATSRTYTLTNAIIFTFNSNSQISYVDNFIDSAEVALSFCAPGLNLTCYEYDVKKIPSDPTNETYHWTVPAGPTNLTAHEQVNYQTLSDYLGYLGQGNINSAINQTSDNVVYIMHALPVLVPSAGNTYEGHSGATSFFTNTSSYFSSFALQDAKIRSLSGNTALVTFLEQSTVKNTQQAYQQVNNIIYQFDNTTNKISQVDIYFNSISVGQALQCKIGTRLQCSSGNKKIILSMNGIMGLSLITWILIKLF